MLKTSEDQQINRDSGSEVVQMRAPAVPLNLTRDLEAKIDGHTFEIPSLPRDTDNTRFSEQFG